ncbi:MAG TPA: TonB-dependent receptor [Blastocatellia bacterium]|nr:TonB-dependent receptor [Blastocatellia bacterium]
MARISTLVFLLFLAPAAIQAQSTGTLRGKVTLADNGNPLHDVAVTIVKLKLSTETDETGSYEFKNVPAGTWAVHAHMEGFPDTVQTVTISGNDTVAADFQMKLKGIREQVTVSATGSEQSTFESFQSVVTLDNIDLTEKGQPSLGEVLDRQPGIAKRSFGPGSSRPIVRGFDGDRVLVLQDGLQLGSIGAQSGDHGEPVDVLSLDRIEVVKGPAALLYGSNAIGGVVNAITGHNLHTDPHAGARGYLTGIGGSNNNQGGTSGGIEYGAGKMLYWGNGSFQRLGDYRAPQVGRIDNSAGYNRGGSGGLGYFGDNGFFSASYGYDQRRYGVPFAGLLEGEPDAQIDLKMRRHAFGANLGRRNLSGFLDSIRLSLNYSDYNHKELEIEDGRESVGTTFDNDLFVYRGVVEQKRRGALTGSFGFWGQRRRYETVGAEALAPPTTQNSIALFGLEEINLKRVAFQFGGRLENNRYAPANGFARSFTGFSGAAGVRVPLWSGGAFVVNYNHSYRAPALEELYNDGPHPGNLTFEIGNRNLRRELGDGVEFSLRHATSKARLEANYFHYSLRDFIFLAPTGDVEDGLPVGEYQQFDARYRGTELRAEYNVLPTLWMLTGLDYVRAELTQANQSLPRIPPLRFRLGADWRWKGIGVRPEFVAVARQRKVFAPETPTDAYALFNVDFSYTITQEHIAHIFSLNTFNLGNTLYRNHSSFIKDLAPEIGRGVRFVYTLRFF